ncbi:MAG: hypothetical protein AAFV19_19620 [Pseudomonadota bacterium]
MPRPSQNASAVAECLGRLGVIGFDENRIALWQVHDEKPNLLLDAAQHHGRLAKVCLGMAWWMRQRHEHFLAHLPARPNLGPEPNSRAA